MRLLLIVLSAITSSCDQQSYQQMKGTENFRRVESYDEVTKYFDYDFNPPKVPDDVSQEEFEAEFDGAHDTIIRHLSEIGTATEGSTGDADFSLYRYVDDFDWLEARFTSRGLQFILVIDAPREWIWLRSDPLNPDQANPAFEFTFRSDRIRVLPRGCDSEAVHFEFANGAIDPSHEHIRLVIERLGSGDLYVWPILGEADPAHPSLDPNPTHARS
jgi:hypothetical protein